jgi:hypothetical protein
MKLLERLKMNPMSKGAAETVRHEVGTTLGFILSAHESFIDDAAKEETEKLLAMGVNRLRTLLSSLDSLLRERQGNQSEKSCR